jgi:prepilin-type N-terminal cleavage/methylation domain-containing protein
MNNKNNKGFSLLEVLIAIILLSIGLLGFARATLIALHHNQAAYLQTLADIQINSLAENLRACGVKNTACTSKAIIDWKTQNAKLFPQAQSIVQAKTKTEDYLITLKWRTASDIKITTATLQVCL